MDFPLSLYFNNEVENIEVLDLCRGDDDYRKIYIVTDSRRKIVIKHFSNTFSDRRRIEGWFSLMDAYRKAGIYCPSIIPNLKGDLICSTDNNGRIYYAYAEEYSIFETAEKLGTDKYKDENGQRKFTPDVMRSLGKIASLRLDILDWPSAYCLLEPFCPPDTTDESTECAIAFVKYVEKCLSDYLPRAKRLLEIFYERQNDVRRIYASLPVSCFQSDLNDSNILLDEDGSFVGLIDFNLCGKEPVLNYVIREALWASSDKRLYGENDSCLYFYDRDLDDLRTELFIKNIGYVQENYCFEDIERNAFPILLRYINSFWWPCVNEIKSVGNDTEKINKIFNWLEHQMTRDDIKLP